MLDQINAVKHRLTNLREQKDITSVKNEIILLERSLRDLHDDYVELNARIRWQNMYRAIEFGSKQQKLKKINHGHINEIYSNCMALINELQREITPKAKRLQHFIGAIAFAFFIPVLKFILSYVNKGNIGANEAIENSLLRFDVLLALVMYQWVVTYSTKNQIRKAIVISMAVISTIVLLLNSFNSIEFLPYNVSAFAIFVFSLATFIIHLIEAWEKYMIQCHKFAYF